MCIWGVANWMWNSFAFDSFESSLKGVLEWMNLKSRIEQASSSTVSLRNISTCCPTFVQHMSNVYQACSQTQKNRLTCIYWKLARIRYRSPSHCAATPFWHSLNNSLPKQTSTTLSSLYLTPSFYTWLQGHNLADGPTQWKLFPGEVPGIWSGYGVKRRRHLMAATLSWASA